MNSVVIKVFGRELASHLVAWEIIKQLSHLGQFHFTTLGRGWFLCSFQSEEMMEAALSGGPWFINGHIVGMEKWSTNFYASSMKGLTSPIWVRMPNLPLQCWDEVNIARIASRIGMPLMMDGNLFQWGRREFARFCVRVKLDQPLPLGIWLNRISGRFFQKVEYEKVANLCFECGLIGHLKDECEKIRSKPSEVKIVDSNNKEVAKGRNLQDKVDEPSYGPWILVNNKKGRRPIRRRKEVKSSKAIYVKKNGNSKAAQKEG
ncbi:hypothetical protein KFK09_022656 [Dendrobium nobile]|uniref:CCHC-type domain-containing protein n=1 Tax=Dendrobium nobile TaxID=94219 RepID=A0A8T3AJR3_DENNO|nr:hypothetical protein KFK09_022656 [Dendrobium nobile]